MRDCDYIIMNWNEIKKRLDDQKPDPEFLNKVSKSLLNLDSQRLKEIYRERQEELAT